MLADWVKQPARNEVSDGQILEGDECVTHNDDDNDGNINKRDGSLSGLSQQRRNETDTRSARGKPPPRYLGQRIPRR